MPGSPLHPPPSQAHLTVDSRTDGGVVTLVVRGEIDLASAPVLEHALRDAEASAGARIVVDLGALDFIDSTGIHLLIDAQQRAASKGREFVITRLPARARRIFNLTGITDRLIVS